MVKFEIIVDIGKTEVWMGPRGKRVKANEGEMSKLCGIRENLGKGLEEKQS